MDPSIVGFPILVLLFCFLLALIRIGCALDTIVDILVRNQF